MTIDKRKEARKRADRLRSKYEQEGTPLLWFDALYKEAEGDAELIPWGNGAQSQSDQPADTNSSKARVPLLNWLNDLKPDFPRGKVLDVGCGLGYNAVALHQAGFDVTAFDISETAVQWAADNYKNIPVTWRTADLLNMPKDMYGKFDLVSETFTIQALKGDMREKAFTALANLVAPEGRLLIVCRGRMDDEDFTPPPWPLTPAELKKFEPLGFKQIRFEQYFDDRDPPQRHFLAEYQRSKPPVSDH